MSIMQPYDHIAFHVLVYRDIDSDRGENLIVFERLLVHKGGLLQGFLILLLEVVSQRGVMCFNIDAKSVRYVTHRFGFTLFSLEPVIGQPLTYRKVVKLEAGVRKANRCDEYTDSDHYVEICRCLRM